MDNINDARPPYGGAFANRDNILWTGAKTIQNALERGATGGALIELAFACLWEAGKLHPYTWQRQKVIDAIAQGLLRFVNPEDTEPVLKLAERYGISREDISASLMGWESQKATEIVIELPSAKHIVECYNVITQSVAHGTRAYNTEIKNLETSGFLAHPECCGEVVTAIVKGLRNANELRRQAVYEEVRLFNSGLASDLNIAIHEMPAAVEPQSASRNAKGTSKKTSAAIAPGASSKASAAAAKSQVTMPAPAAPKPLAAKAPLGPPPPPHPDAK